MLIGHGQPYGSMSYGPTCNCNRMRMPAIATALHNLKGSCIATATPKAFFTAGRPTTFAFSGVGALCL